MQTNSDIYLIGLSIAIFLVVTFFFLKKIASSNELKVEIEEVTDLFDQVDEETERLSQLSFNFSEKSKESHHHDQELIVFNLISMDGSLYAMDQFHGFLSNYNAKLHNGYYSYESNNKEIFRVANALQPGTFDANTNSHAILLVADLNDVDDATLTVNLMLDFATQFSENFHASICDGNRLPLTKQMISHIKSTAQEVSRLKKVSDFA